MPNKTKDSYYMKYNISSEEYYDYLCNINSFYFLQEPVWKNDKAGEKSFLIGLYNNNQIVGVATALMVKLFTGFKMLYIARGPVMDFNNEGLLKVFCDGIVKLAKKKHAVFVKVDPYVINEKLAVQDVSNHKNLFSNTISALEKAGFKHNQHEPDGNSGEWQPRIHKAIPLFDKNSGELFSESNFFSAFTQRMPKSRKYLFTNNYYEKRGVSFKLVKGPHNMDEFAEIMVATEKRKKIFIRDKAYFERVAKIFKDRACFYYASINTDKYIEYQKGRTGNDADIKDATRKIDMAIEKTNKYGEDIIIGACLVIMPHKNARMKIAEYLFAGGNNYFPDVNCSRGLIYRGCIDAINYGCMFFNMGGTPEDPKAPLTVFKNTFYPDTFEFVGEFDLIVNKEKYSIYKNALKIRNRFRGLS